eukprot:CAMPEP_0173406242 /NCGR_PEP_ID=MMETSP1356-20130122/64117_1 /TAXON_ID=77927 ORGANISM="Hemiselmis virescens, Strain PCC157" /NCGR_SAMPLE_ID=MMETSP1356 /ASSEMBLY_ACC=CAM_ASM_000847 /LENGTH=77 /DNA_ID=CAMNT_0014367199 /DNA_START=66 /DNA_END=295 /DNA_ORIENTATION=-
MQGRSTRSRKATAEEVGQGADEHPPPLPQGLSVLEAIGKPVVWRLVADALPLASRVMCSRACGALKALVEADGLDFG